jgi:3-hydroxybutyryl-CoA dehydrogenase
MYVSLYDVAPETLERASTYIETHLARKNKAALFGRLTLTSSLEDMKRCNFVIEAIPEDLPLKQALFAQLDALCPPPSILVSNTSTLPVTAIAAATGSPERVAGMHFFNPAPVLPLVEVVRAAASSEETLHSVVEVAKLMGKTPVIARDTPGFIVNRAARPFYGEALRLAGERAASFEDIDRIVRLGGGFKMGPFQLIDLIGVDVNLAAMQSMYEQTFGEPRYRPHPIQVQMAQQKALGRKTGRGFYSYASDPPFKDPPIPRPGLPRGESAEARPVYALTGAWAPGVEELIRSAGYWISSLGSVGFPSAAPPNALALLGIGLDEELLERVADLERNLPAQALIVCQCGDVTAAELAASMRHPERLVGFDGLFLKDGLVATLTAGPTLSPQARRAAQDFFASLGRLPIWVEDTPGLALPRIVGMLANEAAFAAAEGVAEPGVIDQAMQLGVNYPQGPLAWARQLGLRQVIGVLEHLWREYGEERYRIAPLLRRWERLERMQRGATP